MALEISILIVLFSYHWTHCPTLHNNLIDHQSVWGWVRGHLHCIHSEMYSCWSLCTFRLFFSVLCHVGRVFNSNL